jgi:hypothetical protein
MACPSITLAVPTAADPVTFDCETEDLSNNVWIWTRLDGWWEPPTPSYDTIDLKEDLGQTVTNAQWNPRQITLQATAIIGGTGSLDAARNTLTALCDMLIVPGRITVLEAVPLYSTVYLADKPQHGNVLGAGRGLEVQIPMIAYDVYRRRVSDDVGFL